MQIIDKIRGERNREPRKRERYFWSGWKTDGPGKAAPAAQLAHGGSSAAYGKILGCSLGLLLLRRF